MKVFKAELPRPLMWTAILYATATWWGVNNSSYRDAYFGVAVIFLTISFSLALIFLLINRCVLLLEILVLSTILMSGMFLGAQAMNPNLSPHHIFNLVNFEKSANGDSSRADSKIGIVGKLYASPREYPDRTYLYLEVEQLRTEKGFIPAYGKVRLTVMKSPPYLEYGDRVFAEFRPKEVENFSNPGGFDYKRYLTAEGIFVRGSISDGSAISVLREFPPRRLSARERVESKRRKISRWIEKRGGDKSLEEIMKALLLGERWAVPAEINESFQRAGVAHLLAVSGLHLGLVASLSFFVLSWLLKRNEKIMLAMDVKRICAFFTFFPVLAYTFLAGGRIPTVRAFIMISAYLFAILIRREKDLPSTIALAGLVILLISPVSIIDVGFQLSFSAVIAIAIIAPALGWWRAQRQVEERETLRWKLRFYLVSAIVTTIFIMLFTAPFTSRYFNQISPIAPITNLIFIPLVGYIVLPLGLSACLFHYLIPLFGDTLLRVDLSILSAVVRLLSIFSRVSWGTVLTPPMSIFETVLIVMLTATLAVSFGKPSKNRAMARLATLFLFLLFLSETGISYLLSKAKAPMSVTYLDVGEGNSAVVVTPSRKVIVVDTGPSWGGFNAGERIIAPYLLHEGIRKIDVLLITHPHEDHIGGFDWLIDNFPMGEIFIADAVYPNEFTEKINAIREKKNISLRKLGASSASSLFDGIEIKPFWPPMGFSTDELNDLSLAVSLKYGSVRFIFAGDVSKDTKAVLSVAREKVPVTVLLAPHHGGRDAFSEEILEMLQPKWVVISARYSDYSRLPAEESLELLRARNIPFLRTDVLGALRFRTDGKHLEISHWDGERMRRIGQ